jgi:hypothetical protein
MYMLNSVCKFIGEHLGYFYLLATIKECQYEVAIQILF